MVLEPDELKTFEYASVRVPCEKLNAAFRSHHLLIGKHIHEIDNVTKKLKEEFRSSSNPDAVPLLKVSFLLLLHFIFLICNCFIAKNM